MGIGFGVMFDVFPIIFGIVFVLILGVFVVALVRGISTWNQNNHSPRLTVDAALVSKRADVNVSHHHHNGGGGMAHMHSSTSTTYYVTFQVESGDRMEFVVNGSEYGMLMEGDCGKLTFQGTRYLSFERL